MSGELTLGTCLDALPSSRPLTRLVIELLPLDLVAQWSRCSLVADFLGEFLASGFDARRDVARNELSTVLNELIENAVKFAFDKQELVSLLMINYGDTIRLEASNVCDVRHATDLAEQIRRVLENDAEELFVEQVERTAAEDRLASRLGFITMRKDHGARLGVRITDDAREGLRRVTIQVLLDTEEVVAS
jgi:hypothetical protein